MSDEQITSSAQLQSLIASSKLTVVSFYRTGSASASTVGAFARRFSDKVNYRKCNVAQQTWAVEEFRIPTEADPLFVAFRSGQVVGRMAGVEELLGTLPKLAGAAESSEPSGGEASSNNNWLGAPLTKSFADVSGNIEADMLDILNSNSSFGGVRALVDASKPSGLADVNSNTKDWVESDTDEQLLVFIPFQTAVKLYAIQITSVTVPNDEDDDEIPSRPRTLKLFCNTAQILGFDEAADREATQEVEIKPEEWNKDATAIVNTRYVKFQNCSAITLFFVEPERDGAEKIRIDRVRLIGEKLYEKPDMTKLKQQQEEQ